MRRLHMRTHAEDTEVTRLLRERDHIDARLAALGIDLAKARPASELPPPRYDEEEDPCRSTA